MPAEGRAVTYDQCYTISRLSNTLSIVPLLLEARGDALSVCDCISAQVQFCACSTDAFDADYSSLEISHSSTGVTSADKTARRQINEGLYFASHCLRTRTHARYSVKANRTRFFLSRARASRSCRVYVNWLRHRQRERAQKLLGAKLGKEKNRALACRSL